MRLKFWKKQQEGDPQHPYSDSCGIIGDHDHKVPLPPLGWKVIETPVEMTNQVIQQNGSFWYQKEVLVEQINRVADTLEKASPSSDSPSVLRQLAEMLSHDIEVDPLAAQHAWIGVTL